MGQLQPAKFLWPASCFMLQQCNAMQKVCNDLGPCYCHSYGRLHVMPWAVPTAQSGKIRLRSVVFPHPPRATDRSAALANRTLWACRAAARTAICWGEALPAALIHSAHSGRAGGCCSLRAAAPRAAAQRFVSCCAVGALTRANSSLAAPMIMATVPKRWVPHRIVRV